METSNPAVQLLKEAGIFCWPANGDSETRAGKFGDYIIDHAVMCVQEKRADRYTGVIFWIHSREPYFLLGLMSGLIYRCDDEGQLIAAVKSLMLEDAIPRGKTPCEIPEDVAARFGFREVRMDGDYPRPHGYRAKKLGRPKQGITRGTRF